MKKLIFFTIILISFFFSINIFAAENVAKLGSVEYASLADAIAAASSNQSTITVLKDISLAGKLSFPKGSNITLDLNGKSIDVPTVENNYGIVVAGNLTIKGKGMVSLGMYGIGVTASGNLTIEDGTYKCQTGDYLLGSWGKVVIKGGLFDGNYCIANGFNSGTIEILDGTFYAKESTIVLGGTKIFGGRFNHNVDDYLADGVEMKSYNGLYYTGNIYKIIVENTKNGTVETLTEAIEKQPVKIVTTANKGYELNEIKVTSTDGKILQVTNSEFVMPSNNVTVYVMFAKAQLDTTPNTGNIDIVFILSVFTAIVLVVIILIKRKIWNS